MTKILAVFVLLATSSDVTAAAMLQTEGHISIGAYFSQYDSLWGTIHVPSQASTNNPLSLSLGQDFSLPDVPVSTYADARSFARATFGRLDVGADANANDSYADDGWYAAGFAGAHALAQMQDTWTFAGRSGKGILRVYGDCVTHTQSGDGRALQRLTIANQLGCAQGEHYSDVSFVWGEPLSVIGLVEAWAGDGGSGNSEGGIASVTIEQLQVLDALHEHPIHHYRFRTESGALYNFVGGTMVPEPVTGSLTALALLGGALIRLLSHLRRN